MSTGRFSANLQINHQTSKMINDKYLAIAHKSLMKQVEDRLYDGKQYSIRFSSTTKEYTELYRVVSVHLDLFLLHPKQCEIGEFWYCGDRHSYTQMMNNKVIEIITMGRVAEETIGEISLLFEIAEDDPFEGYFIAVRTA